MGSEESRRQGKRGGVYLETVGKRYKTAGYDNN